MKNFIAKKKQTMSDMRFGGAYSSSFLEAKKKVFIAEMVLENKRIAEDAKTALDISINSIKGKYKMEELSVEELHLFENKLKTMRTSDLSELSCNAHLDPKTPAQIYALGAILRDRDSKLADRFSQLIESTNLLEPWRNDEEYIGLGKPQSMINLMENSPETFYVTGDNITDVKGIIDLNKVLD